MYHTTDYHNYLILSPTQIKSPHFLLGSLVSKLVYPIQRWLKERKDLGARWGKGTGIATSVRANLGLWGMRTFSGSISRCVKHFLGHWSVFRSSNQVLLGLMGRGLDTQSYQKKEGIYTNNKKSSKADHTNIMAHRAREPFFLLRK